MPIVTILSATASYPDLPAPLTPPDCDLKGMPYMPLVVDRLWRSKAWVRAKAKPELGFYLINLWSAAFFSVPAASLEDDDELLCDLAMCDPGRWAGVRADVLRGWTKCSDGRLYHQEVADRALEAWKGRKGYRDRLAAARAAKKEKAEAAKHGGLSMQKHGGLSMRTAAGTETAKPADEAKSDSIIEPITELSQVLKVQGIRYKDREVRETPLRESCRSAESGPVIDEPKDMPPSTVVKMTRPPRDDRKILGTDLDPDFCEFWHVYPRKDGKGAARMAWRTARGKASAQTILDGCRKYPFNSKPCYWPMPTTWLNGERWLAHHEADTFDPVLRAVGLSPEDFEAGNLMITERTLL